MANNSIKHSSETYNDLAEFIEDSAFYKIFWSKCILFYGKEMKKNGDREEKEENEEWNKNDRHRNE